MQLSYLIVGLAAICNIVSAFQMGGMSRRSYTLRSSVDDKAEVTEYFNNDGFSRWNKIYSEAGEVNKVQLDIRTGHQQTIDKVLNWMSDENNKAKSVCDAGCGVGSLALPMSKLYKKVSASDISSSMTKEAAARAKLAKLNNLDFKVADMETLGGKYNTVTCIDVMIHYPTDKVAHSPRILLFVLIHMT
jgi:magnesium-protoporphyrin O-methyltransferase